MAPRLAEAAPCVEQDFAEAIAQLALYPPGREALLKHPTMAEVLQQVNVRKSAHVSIVGRFLCDVPEGFVPSAHKSERVGRYVSCPCWANFAAARVASTLPY